MSSSGPVGDAGVECQSSVSYVARSGLIGKDRDDCQSSVSFITSDCQQ